MASDNRPAQLARATELVASAFAEVMTERGMLPGTIAAIRADAEARIAFVLDQEFADASAVQPDTP